MFDLASFSSFWCVWRTRFVGTLVLMAVLHLAVAGDVRAATDAQRRLEESATAVGRATSVEEMADAMHRYLEAGGAAKGILNLADSAQRRFDQPLEVSAPSNQSAPIASTKKTIDMASIPIGQTSPPQSVTLTNTGATTLTFQTGSPSVSTYYGFKIASTTCGATLPAGGSCTAAITFTPTTNGLVTDNYSANFVGYASGGSVRLRGMGGTAVTPSSLPVTITPAPASGYSYSRLDFGSVTVGQTSAEKTVTVTNTGAATLTFMHRVSSTPDDERHCEGVQSRGG